MLDVGWTELLVIAVVLIVVVGPKDLPPMLRAFGKMTTRLRAMAGDFRSQFDEALREADMDDVRKTIGDAQKLNPMSSLRDAINPLRQTANEIKSDLQRAAAVDRPAEPVKVTVDTESPEAMTPPSIEPVVLSSTEPAAATPVVTPTVPAAAAVVTPAVSVTSAVKPEAVATVAAPASTGAAILAAATEPVVKARAPRKAKVNGTAAIDVAGTIADKPKRTRTVSTEKKAAALKDAPAAEKKDEA